MRKDSCVCRTWEPILFYRRARDRVQYIDVGSKRNRLFCNCELGLGEFSRQCGCIRSNSGAIGTIRVGLFLLGM